MRRALGEAVDAFGRASGTLPAPTRKPAPGGATARRRGAVYVA
jgi:hypothetical protein